MPPSKSWCPCGVVVLLSFASSFGIESESGVKNECERVVVLVVGWWRGDDWIGERRKGEENNTATIINITWILNTHEITTDDNNNNDPKENHKERKETTPLQNQ